MQLHVNIRMEKKSILTTPVATSSSITVNTWACSLGVIENIGEWLVSEASDFYYKKFLNV